VSEFDELLGSDAPAATDVPERRRMGRPTNEERARRAEQLQRDAQFQREVRMAGQGKGAFQPEEYFGLCTQNQIGRLLGMDPMTVKQRLQAGGAKPAGTVGSGRPVWMFRDVIPYLVKPKMDIDTYIKTLNPTDLPNSINKTYWEAQRIKNKALIETGEAWDDASVLEVFGAVFMLFKDRLPLVTEGMREEGLTEKQSDKLAGFIDQLQRDLHARLVEMPQQRRLTLSRQQSVMPDDGPTVAEFYGDEVEAD
jgi:hypothetical protein